MTALSSLIVVPSIPVASATNVVGSAAQASSVGALKSTSSPSSIVTIPYAATLEALDTYSADGTLENVAPTVTWATKSLDPVTLAMMGDYTSPSLSGQFYNLGSTLLNGFKTSGSDFSQSVQVGSASATNTIGQEIQGPQANLRLTIQTASGIKVDIALDSENGGLSVSVHSSGKLSDAERSAIAGLSDGFQKAINGLTAVPPSLDLSGLSQFDTSVLSSVTLQSDVSGEGVNDLSMNLAVKASGRSLSITGPSGTMNISVDTSNSALWGTAAQRTQAIDSYLKQFDNAQSKGHGDAALMSMFKDAFTQMNSNYGTASQTLPGTLYAPWLAQSDQSMLSGLADFSASVNATPVSSNPYHLSETDSFSYQVSQTTQTEGNASRGLISQNQNSHLSANYHLALDGVSTPKLSSMRSSQNYYYVQIDDSANSTTNISTEQGFLLGANSTQSSSDSTRTLEYEQSLLISDVPEVSNQSQSRDLLTLLKPFLESGDAERNTDAWQKTLAGIRSALLQGDAAA